MSPRGDATRPACGSQVRVASFVDEALRDPGVSIDAPVAQERPVLAGFFDFAEVAFRDEHLFLVVRRLGDDFAERIAHERTTPELHGAFDSDAVRCCDEAAVGDGVCPLDRDPRIVLFSAVLVLLALMPADSRGIEKDLRALERSEARAFGVPLVPTYERADVGVLGLERLETEIARREVELLVVERVIRYV